MPQAFASSNASPYQLDWRVPGEALVYRSCGCADGCWGAEVRVRRPQFVKARLRCDCERLSFAQAPTLSSETLIGGCSPINGAAAKFSEITRELELRTGVVLPPPKTASEAIERVESCSHFAGEFNGDGSERDQEINRQLTRLDCGKAVRRLKVFKERLPRGSAQRDKIADLLRAWE